MTSVYLNPPTASSFSVVEKQLQLFLTPRGYDSSSSAAASYFPDSTCFNTIGDQIQTQLGDHDQIVTYKSDGTPSSAFKTEGGDHDNRAEKWMPLKVRIMQKLMNSNCLEADQSQSPKLKVKLKGLQCRSHAINSDDSVRVCADCNTTTTPLWRSGPLGPKSLCNACGIRQRKAKRAMAAAAAELNGTVIGPRSSSTRKSYNKGHNKQKKWKDREGKKQGRPHKSATRQGRKKFCFRNLALSWSRNSSNFERVFPPDVEEAAILLMELSCGFIYS